MWSHLADENSVFTRDVGDALPCQGAHPGQVDSICHRLAMPLTYRRIAYHQPRSLKGHQVLIQAGPAHIDVPSKRADRTRALFRQGAQNSHLSTVSNECDCHVNLLGEVGLDKSRHSSILPDTHASGPNRLLTL